MVRIRDGNHSHAAGDGSQGLREEVLRPLDEREVQRPHRGRGRHHAEVGGLPLELVPQRPERQLPVQAHELSRSTRSITGTSAACTAKLSCTIAKSVKDVDHEHGGTVDWLKQVVAWNERPADRDRGRLIRLSG